MKLHIDTDIGGDLDDLCALALVLKWPDANLVGVTTNCEVGGRRAGYARYALDLAGRPDVVVAAGADIAGGHYRVPMGFPDEVRYWPEAVRPLPGRPEAALDLLEQSILDGVRIAAIGAFTNLALLERRRPGILAGADLVLMGGYVHPPRPGFPEWGRNMDWNNQVDVESARLVLQSSNPLLVPLTVTIETALGRSDLAALRMANPLARLIAHQAEAFALDEGNDERYGLTCHGLPRDIINFLHDPLACAIALGWRDGVVVEDARLFHDVEDGWLRQRVDPSGTPARLVTRIDGERFDGHWLSVVARSAAATIPG